MRVFVLTGGAASQHHLVDWKQIESHWAAAQMSLGSSRPTSAGARRVAEYCWVPPLPKHHDGPPKQTSEPEKEVGMPSVCVGDTVLLLSRSCNGQDESGPRSMERKPKNSTFKGKVWISTWRCWSELPGCNSSRSSVGGGTPPVVQWGGTILKHLEIEWCIALIHALKNVLETSKISRVEIWHSCERNAPCFAHYMPKVAEDLWNPGWIITSDRKLSFLWVAGRKWWENEKMSVNC